MADGDGAVKHTRQTIYHVAERAGVSLATVSRFMNESGYVGAQARQCIETAIRELDYVPSQPARALGGGRSGLVVLGVRRDGQKVLLAVKNMGGESEAAWRAILDDLAARGLRAPEFVLVDGAPGLEKALTALWPDHECG